LHKTKKMQYYNSPKSLYQKDKERISHIIPKIPFTLESVMLKLPGGKDAKLPLLKPTLGSPMIDIRTLL
jgi:hypothetical protein